MGGHMITLFFYHSERGQEAVYLYLPAVYSCLSFFPKRTFDDAWADDSRTRIPSNS